MKYRNKKTREIVEIISFSNNVERSKDDYVSYIDSKGGEHPREKGLNINWDFEIAGCEETCINHIQGEYMMKNVSSINPMDTFNLIELGNQGWELCSAIHYDRIYQIQFIFKRPKEVLPKCNSMV